MEENISKRQEFKKTLPDRLREFRKRSGLRTTEAFISTVAEELFVGAPTVSGWYYGKTFPEMDNLIRLCEYFDCDLDYLLGRIDKTKHSIKFICEETHLSENAIRCLMRMETTRKDLLSNTHVVSYRPLHDAINNLLSEKEGQEVLKTIGLYLYSGELQLSLNGETVKQPLQLQSMETDERYPFSPSNYPAIQLLAIQTKLAEIRAKLALNDEKL